MVQSSKQQYLSQKSKNGSNKGKTSGVAVQGKKSLTTFENLVLFLLLIFIIAIPLSFFINKQIMVYAGLINYIIIGLAIAVRPQFLTEIMRKNSNRKADEVYEKRMKKMTVAIRIFGILFVGIGVAFFYFLVLQA